MVAMNFKRYILLSVLILGLGLPLFHQHDHDNHDQQDNCSICCVLGQALHTSSQTTPVRYLSYHVTLVHYENKRTINTVTYRHSPRAPPSFLS